jgi:hypothetical protein
MAVWAEVCVCVYVGGLGRVGGGKGLLMSQWLQRQVQR